MRFLAKVAAFLMPDKWKIAIVLYLFIGNYYGHIFLFQPANLASFPINYVYWTSPPETTITKGLLGVVHVLYLYLLACFLIDIFMDTRRRATRNKRFYSKVKK